LSLQLTVTESAELSIFAEVAFANAAIQPTFKRETFSSDEGL